MQESSTSRLRLYYYPDFDCYANDIFHSTKTGSETDSENPPKEEDKPAKSINTRSIKEQTESDLNKMLKCIGPDIESAKKLNQIEPSSKTEEISECLENANKLIENFKKNEIAEKFPDFKFLDYKGIKLLDGYYLKCLSDHNYLEAKLYIIYEHVRYFRRLMSCVQLDNQFIDKLAIRLRGKECIEIYAGNGILTDELSKKKVSIIAFDTFAETTTYRDDTYHAKYRKEVTNKCAKKAAYEFAERLKTSGNKQGVILLGFPSGCLETLRCVLYIPLKYPNISVIGIAIGCNIEKPADREDWMKIPCGVRTCDITSEVNYTRSHLKESVIEYAADPLKIPTIQQRGTTAPQFRILVPQPETPTLQAIKRS